jgi:hypothetical protein
MSKSEKSASIDWLGNDLKAIAVSTTNVDKHQCRGHLDAAATATARDDREKKHRRVAVNVGADATNNSDKQQRRGHVHTAATAVAYQNHWQHITG